MSDPFITQFIPAELSVALAKRNLGWIRPIEYFESISSTNDYLLGMSDSVHGRLCISDYQTRGKGRRGQQWHASKGTNLMFSLGWAPAGPLRAETSLILGVALADALTEAGVEGVGLKWPNDVLVAGRKLAGVLVESRVRGAQVELVMGVGLNVRHQQDDMQPVERPWVDLASLGMELPDRPTLLLSILTQLARRLAEFETSGFASVREDWLAYHIYQGCEMSYQHQGRRCTGQVVGLDDQGALLLQTDDGLFPVHSGEVNSLRAL